MIILGIDTTGESMSAAIVNDGRLLGEIYIDSGKKHAQTLMLAVDSLFSSCGLKISDVDGFAVAVGPGSFTGIRIGTATVSAFAYAMEKPVYSVNTLDALINNVRTDDVVCAIMDARRGEVYVCAKQQDKYLIKENALPLVEVVGQLIECGPTVFVGDAAMKYKDEILKIKQDSLFLPQQFMLQRASSVCMCASIGEAKVVLHNELKPNYLRKSQAERQKGV